MSVGIVTVIYDGYGKFLDQFVEFVLKSTVQPEQLTIVLGKKHGVTAEQKKAIKEKINVVFVYDRKDNPNVGRLSNAGIAKTDTEWIMVMDVDDLILPKSLEVFSLVEHKADYICIGWRLYLKGKMYHYTSPLPSYWANLKPNQRSKRRINNNSPFRRKLWEANQFAENNWCTLKFIADCVEQGARFIQVSRACITYRQWHGSMYGSDEWKDAKPEVIKDVQDMYARIQRYYAKS